MTRQSNRAFLALFAAGFLASGCMSLGPNTKMARLDKSVQTYNTLVRWGEHERAVAFLERTRQEMAYRTIKDLRNIRVTAYEVKRLAIAPDQNSAEYHVQFEYINERSWRERHYLDRQRWVWHEDEGNWRLDGTLPNFDTAALR